jgi:hypothetical protein
MLQAEVRSANACKGAAEDEDGFGAHCDVMLKLSLKEFGKIIAEDEVKKEGLTCICKRNK